MTAKKGFLRNTALMFTAMFISKAFGALLKIPLGNILGGEGMGYFTTAYSIYMPVLAFATAGIPTILTRTAAECVSLGDYRRLLLYRRSSLLLSILLGLAGSILIYISSFPFVYLIVDSPESITGVFLIAPATVFCSVTAVYRGYYEGLSDTLPTAASQVIESVVRAVSGLGLSYYVYANGERFFGSVSAAMPYSAAAAILGVTLSEFSSMIFMFIRSRRKADRLMFRGCRVTAGELPDICRKLFMTALPLSLGAAASNLLSLADMLTISNCIDLSVSIFGDLWKNDTLLSQIRDNTSDIGNYMYGCYAGIIIPVYLLAASVSGVVARCSFPRISSAVVNGTGGKMEREVRLLIKGTAAITAPATVFVAVLAEPIMKIIYPMRTMEAQLGGLPLSVLSISGIIPALLGAVYMIFDAHGDYGFPIKMILLGGGMRIVFNIMFITIPLLNITGAAVSSVLSGAICLLFSVKKLKSRYNTNVHCVKYSVPAVMSALIGGTGAYLFYSGLKELAGILPSLLISVISGGIIYSLMMYLTDKDDCNLVLRRIHAGKK
ncbi:MAG: oligosaccharide flippase family protein [Ruminiclostridium sp.]|nr:oligosaccharide flippase family protein [Ruminiclostridium sp.]